MQVLAVGGEHSMGIGPFEQFRQLAHTAQGDVIADSGHWVIEEQTDKLVANSRNFLSERSRRDSARAPWPRELGKHPATVYRWIGDYKRSKRLSVFLRKERSDRRTSRLSRESCAANVD